MTFSHFITFLSQVGSQIGSDLMFKNVKLMSNSNSTNCEAKCQKAMSCHHSQGNNDLVPAGRLLKYKCQDDVNEKERKKDFIFTLRTPG